MKTLPLLLLAGFAFAETLFAVDPATSGDSGRGSTASSAPSVTWKPTGSLADARGEHTGTLLNSGLVLVAGGFGVSGSGPELHTAELYDPASGTWTGTSDCNREHRAHTATLLQDGRVLVAAGLDLGAHIVAIAELYDPTSGTWSFTSKMHHGRYRHTATLLQTGRVLVAGGNYGDALATAEVYDPVAGKWATTGNLNVARWNHTATLLPNGMVLVTGGTSNFNQTEVTTSAELYDPVARSWDSTGSLHTGRAYHTATLLPDGRVLVAGGWDGNFIEIASAELYDPATGAWTETSSLHVARSHSSATLLPNGKVLMTGGYAAGDALTATELYDPGAGTWTVTGELNVARWGTTATLLPTGRVLVAGGFNTGGYSATDSAELSRGRR